MKFLVMFWMSNSSYADLITILSRTNQSISPSFSYFSSFDIDGNLQQNFGAPSRRSLSYYNIDSDNQGNTYTLGLDGSGTSYFVSVHDANGVFQNDIAFPSLGGIPNNPPGVDNIPQLNIFSPISVPEPNSFAMFGIAMLGLFRRCRVK